MGEEGETQVVAGADAVQADQGLVSRDIWLLRLRALLARAHGDAAVYNQLRDRCRDMAKTLWLRRAYRVGRGNAMTLCR